jgi:excisionase family DNA binding protein
MNSSEIMDFGEAQEYLGISRSTLLRWIRDGRVPGYKAGRKWKFYRQDLERLLLKEPQAVYHTRSFACLQEELQELGCSDVPEDPGQLRDAFWCNWQDREGWLWLTCMPGGDTAELLLQPADPGAGPRSWPLTPAAAGQLVCAWQTWSGSGAARPSRPGRFKHVQGASGTECFVLSLTRHINTLPALEEWFPDEAAYAACRQLMTDMPQDWLVTGPPQSVTACAAYALAQRIAECNTTLVTHKITCEQDYTCFWPDAIQVYSPGIAEPAGADCSIYQLDPGNALPARSLRSPRVRIGYCFTPEPPEQHSAVHVIHVTVTASGNTWQMQLKSL